MNFLKLFVFKKYRSMSFLVGFISGCILLLSFLFGQGILVKPKISIICGSSSYKVPFKLEMQNFILKLMFTPEDLEAKILKELEKTLKKYGLDEKKVKLIINATKEKKEKKRTELKLKPYEENIVMLATSEVSTTFIPSVFNEIFDFPKGVLFFEVSNKGRKSAHKVHLKVRLNGSIYGEPQIEGDPKLISSSIEKNEISYDYENLPPRSRIKGVIWYSPPIFSPDKIPQKREEHQIIVTFEEGSISKKVVERDIWAME